MIWIIAALIGLGLLYWLSMSPWSQIFGKFPYETPTQEKVIALTFDDGPNEPYTSQIGNYLNQEGIRATFFQVGHCIQRYPDVTKHLERQGHVIGNHSLSHRFGKAFIQPTFAREMRETQEIIEATIGKRPVLFRPPWLQRTPLLLSSARKLGLAPVSGVFAHSREVLQIPAHKIATAAFKHAKPGGILIFHDGFDDRTGDRTQTVKAIKLFVPMLKEAGYTFVTVDELLGVNAYKKI